MDLARVGVIIPLYERLLTQEDLTTLGYRIYKYIKNKFLLSINNLDI
jgi:hypothetical protein